MELFGMDDLRTAEAMVAVTQCGEQDMEESYGYLMHALKVRKAQVRSCSIKRRHRAPSVHA
jgi:hypothetical protein